MLPASAKGRRQASPRCLAMRAVRIDTDIERMALSADKRRALVLTASELVVNALTHAFRGGSGGRIGVSLRRRGNMFGGFAGRR